MPDFIGRFTGGNPATNYLIPPRSNAVKEFLKVFISKGPTVHGCSGPAASRDCKNEYGNYYPVIVGPNGVK